MNKVAKVVGYTALGAVAFVAVANIVMVTTFAVMNTKYKNDRKKAQQ